MRECQACHKRDAAILEPDTTCKGQCDPKADERVETHTDLCPRLSHDVRKYLKAVTRNELIHSPDEPEGRLAMRLRLQGWKMLREGPDYFRWKMLCRDCIGLEAQKEAQQRDYRKACKSVLGAETQTYGQMMIANSA